MLGFCCFTIRIGGFSMLRFYRTPALSVSATQQLRLRLEKEIGRRIDGVTSEWCFYVQTSRPLSVEEQERLTWFLSETYEPENFSEQPFLDGKSVLEIGPR